MINGARDPANAQAIWLGSFAIAMAQRHSRAFLQAQCRSARFADLAMGSKRNSAWPSWKRVEGMMKSVQETGGG